MWLTLGSALDLARDLPWLATHVAEIGLPPSIVLEPFASEPLHATAYGPTQDLAEAVVRIVPAE